MQKITTYQKTLILLRIDTSCFTEGEKDRVRAEICTYSEPFAWKVINRQKQLVQERTGIKLKF